jgi:hypothetical protein
MRRALLDTVLAQLFPAPASSFAQTQKPGQEDGIWAWHDGGRGAAEREKTAGIAPHPRGITPDRANSSSTALVAMARARVPQIVHELQRLLRVLSALHRPGRAPSARIRCDR